MGMSWLYRGGSSRKSDPFMTLVVIGAVACVMLVKYGWNGQHKKKQEEIHAKEKAANGQAQIFWQALIKDQWRRAQTLVSERSTAQLLAFAQRNGEEGIVGGLYLLRQGLPSTLSSKEDIDCDLKYEEKRLFNRPFEKTRPVVSGSCLPIVQGKPWNLAQQESLRASASGFVHFEMIYEGEAWKVASFRWGSAEGELLLNQEQMSVPQRR